MNTGSVLKIDSSNFFSGDVFNYVTNCMTSLQALCNGAEETVRPVLGATVAARRNENMFVVPKCGTICAGIQVLRTGTCEAQSLLGCSAV
jgi:hypothetical protein